MQRRLTRFRALICLISASCFLLTSAASSRACPGVITYVNGDGFAPPTNTTASGCVTFIIRNEFFDPRDFVVSRLRQAASTVVLTGHAESFQDVIGDLHFVCGDVFTITSPQIMNASATITVIGGQTVGAYDTTFGTWFLKGENSSGNADLAFGYGPAPSTLLQVAGRWTIGYSSLARPGLFDPITSTFFLRNSYTPGPANATFSFGASNQDLQPIAGDWNNDGMDGIGVYSATTGTFFLRNSADPGPADIAFQFGPAGQSLIALAGDWDGDGTTSIGLYDPATASFFLRNSNKPGPADDAFTYGVPGMTPVVGDWDANGTTTIGVVDPATAAWFLRNSNSPGSADTLFNYGVPGQRPIAGFWDIVFPRGAQQARATERAQLRLTDTSTVVARAR